MRRGAAASMLIFWLGASLACHYPALPRKENVSSEGLRRAMASTSTALAATSRANQATYTMPAPVTTMTPLSLSTAEEQATPTGTLPPGSPQPPVYRALSGDTLPALAARFGVLPAQITSRQPLPASGLIPPGQELYIPNLLERTPYPLVVLPDSEVINSPTAADFDATAFINQAGGYLSTYQERVQSDYLSGAEIVKRVALESSVNPRFLLALLELRAGWVMGPLRNPGDKKYPIGFGVANWEGLYKELVITATHLNGGYYGWRSGEVTEITFLDGNRARLSPELNAGSVAVQVLMSKLYRQPDWQAALYGTGSTLTGVYAQLFGDPWKRAARAGELFSAGVTQPVLELPFLPGERWSLTGGPHPSWKTGSPRGAIDLAPVTGELRCAVSYTWATASAAGLVVRSERNVVAIDLDGDGFEGTGWVVIYMHIADKERIAAGAWVKTDDRLGHPSCEGGTSTGAHVHIARKYNGEWIAADGPLPMVLSGWQVYAGEKNYQGELRNGSLVAVASPVGPRTSIVIR